MPYWIRGTIETIASIKATYLREEGQAVADAISEHGRICGINGTIGIAVDDVAISVVPLT